MDVTRVRVKVINNEKHPRLKGFASVTLDDCFAVRNIRIIEKTDKLFIAMPNTRLKNGDFIDIAFPTNAETRQVIENAILTEYNKMHENN